LKAAPNLLLLLYGPFSFSAPAAAAGAGCVGCVVGVVSVDAVDVATFSPLGEEVAGLGSGDRSFS